jgi:hypothetical protein
MDIFIFSEAVVLHAKYAYQNVRTHNGRTVPLLRQYHAMRARQLRKLGAMIIEVLNDFYHREDDKCIVTDVIHIIIVTAFFSQAMFRL